jgi:hypothetical protein
MLRRVVQIAALGLVIVGVWLLARGVVSPGAQALLLGAVIFLAVRFERWRDRVKPSIPQSAWRSTGERFEDPGSGKTVQVEYNTQTGERRYKSDGEH